MTPEKIIKRVGVTTAGAVSARGDGNAPPAAVFFTGSLPSAVGAGVYRVTRPPIFHLMLPQIREDMQHLSAILRDALLRGTIDEQRICEIVAEMEILMDIPVMEGR